ncbi:MAG: hypothetical protein OER82_01850 [Nitrosopumilus sp.]|nr:hypothetical protein [Nitrosopumilus sp.]
MPSSLFGQVVRVRKFTNGDIEIDFYHEDEITEYRYSSHPDRLGNFPKELAETLASTLTTNICIEIYFDEDYNPTHIELEECGDMEDDEDDLVIDNS